MKRKIVIICFIFLLGLSGCKKEEVLMKPYDMQAEYAKETGDTADMASSFAENLCIVTENIIPDENFSVTGEAAVLFDINEKKVLVSKNAYEKLYPASITKIMTALIVMKYGNLNDMITVTEDAMITEKGATLCGLKTGDTLSMEQLLHGLLIRSGNDAGSAIAIHMAGSIEAFAEMMNQEALSLGATNSHFVNPHGLHDDNHYTTAYDLYLIFNELIKYQEILDIIHLDSYTTTITHSDGTAEEVTWKSTNMYLTGEMDLPENITVIGGKTGTTNAAGSCLIQLSKDFDDNSYISVILKSLSRKDLFEDTSKLLMEIDN